MKPIDKATELKKKFGSSSIHEVNKTIGVWDLKRSLREKDEDVHGLNICDRTLKYWNKVLTILKSNNGIHIPQQKSR